jgi:hypothetical protein
MSSNWQSPLRQPSHDVIDGFIEGDKIVGKIPDI